MRTPYLALGLLFCGSLLTVGIKLETIFVGYEIAKLKEQEGELLKRKNLLMAEQAKLTTKEQLLKRLNTQDQRSNNESPADE